VPSRVKPNHMDRARPSKKKSEIDGFLAYLVLKYPVFYEMLQKYIYLEKQCFVFMHTLKSLKDIKNNHIVVLYNIENFKKYVLTCFFSFQV